jgi:hypothetical protein
MRNATRSALVLLALAAPAGPTGADQVHGTGSFNKEKVTFSHGVATWKGGKLSLGFFTAQAGATEKPYLVVDLTMKEPAAAPSAENVQYCHIGFYGFKDSPSLDYNGFAKDCGIVLSGDLKPGGVVTAKLTGTKTFEAMGSFPAKDTAWDLSMTTTPRPSSAAVSSEVAVGPKATRLPPGGGEPGKALVAAKCKDLPASNPLAALGMSHCKVLGGSQDAAAAVLEVEADTMGTRMRNDFVLVKDGTGWKVVREDAWRAVAK